MQRNEEVSESSQESSHGSKAPSQQTPTEMVLHMKGPIYSIAERTESSLDLPHSTQKGRAYLVNAQADQFFRKPMQDYASLKLANPNISSKALFTRYFTT